MSGNTITVDQRYWIGQVLVVATVNTDAQVGGFLEPGTYNVIWRQLPCSSVSSNCLAPEVFNGTITITAAPEDVPIGREAIVILLVALAFTGAMALRL